MFPNHSKNKSDWFLSARQSDSRRRESAVDAAAGGVPFLWRAILKKAIWGEPERGRILYNIHHPSDPEHFSEAAHDWVGLIKKKRDYVEC